jgi:hypothetical protein
MAGSFDTFEEAASFERVEKGPDDREWSYQHVVDLETGAVTMIAEPEKLVPQKVVTWP